MSRNMNRASTAVGWLILTGTSTGVAYTATQACGATEERRAIAVAGGGSVDKDLDSRTCDECGFAPHSANHVCKNADTVMLEPFGCALVAKTLDVTSEFASHSTMAVNDREHIITCSQCRLLSSAL